MRKNWKTTVIGVVNLVALCLLLVLLTMEKINSDEFMLIIGGVNSAVVTILGLFTADINKEKK